MRDIDPCADDKPSVYFNVSSGTTLSGSNPVVEVRFVDDFRVISTQLTLNGSSTGFTRSDSWIEHPKALKSNVTLTPVAGSNVLAANVCDDHSPQQCSTTQLTFTYEPPPPPDPRQNPVVYTTPHHSGFVDAGTSGSTLAYSTPAYVSMDQPRSVTLFYASGQAAPRALIQLDVRDPSGTPASRISLQVRDSVTNALQTLQNGATEVVYTGPGSGLYARVAAQLDMTGKATGAYAYLAVVRSYWQETNGTWSHLEQTVPVRVVVVNERTSAYGSGWSLAGVPRAWAQPSGQAPGVVMTDGSGTAAFFAQKSCTTTTGGTTNCEFESPAGDFSTVTSSNWMYVRTFRDGSSITFGTGGVPYRVSDRFGRTTQFTTSGSLVTGITDPAGKVTTLTYTNGKLSQITDPSGRSTLFTVNAAGDLVQVTDAVGVAALRPTYDANHRLASWLDRGGNPWQVGYHAATGTLASITAPAVTVNGVSQTPVTQVTTLEKAVLVTTGGSTLTSPAPFVTSSNVRIVVTDPRGHQTKVAVDRFGLPTRVEQPLGHWVSQSRNSHGQVEWESSSSGAQRQYKWDGPRLQSSYDAVTKLRMNVDYDGAPYDEPKRVSQDGFDIWYEYGTTGETAAIRLGSETGPATTFTYDSRFRVRTRTSPGGETTQFFYDAGNAWMNTDSVRQVTPDSSAQRTAFRYDARGRMIRAVNPKGDSVRVALDDLNRMMSQTDPGGRTTSFTYGNLFLERVTDASGKVYEYARNPLGWLLWEKDTNGRATTYTHDLAGNVASRTNRVGQTISFTYDALGRAATRTAGGQTTTYGYDNPAGRWMAVANAESVDTVRFDAMGRVEKVVNVMGGQTYNLNSTLSPEGVRTRMDLVAPHLVTRSVEYGYSPAQRLEWLRDLAGDTTRLTYTSDRRLDTVTLPGGLRRWHVYSSRGLMHEARYSNSSTDAVLGREYYYDVMDRLYLWRAPLEANSYNFNWGSVAPGESFSYDAPGQLSRWNISEFWVEETCDGLSDVDCIYSLAGQTTSTKTYSYDNVGNRTDSGATLQASSNRYATFGGYTLGYDNEGRLTSKTGNGLTQTFTWNALSQLASVTTNGVTVSYGYSGWGLRVRRTQGSTVVRYLYDGDDLLMELDGNGNPIREYTSYPGIDRPHSMRQWANGANGAKYYYATDYSANVTGLMTAAGAAVNQYRYTPFGETQAAFPQEGTTNPLQFMSREVDATSKLYYVRNRWYDPQLGRFVSEDPIGLAGGINTYAYASGDPVNRWDPYGLSDECSNGSNECPVQLPGLIAVGTAVLRFGTSAFGSFISSRGRFFGRGDGRFDLAFGGGGSSSMSRAPASEQSPIDRECSGQAFGDAAVTGAKYGAVAGGIVYGGIGVIAGGTGGAVTGAGITTVVALPSGPGAFVAGAAGFGGGGVAGGVAGGVIGLVVGIPTGAASGAATNALVAQPGLCVWAIAEVGFDRLRRLGT